VVGGAALVEFGAPGVTPRIVCGEHGLSPVSSSPTYSKTLLKDAGWRAPDAPRREDPGRAQRWAVEMPQAKQIVYFRPFFDLSNPNLEKLIVHRCEPIRWGGESENTSSILPTPSRWRV
jgi:hypothetical protein